MSAPGVELLVESAGDPTIGARIGYAQSVWAEDPIAGAPVQEAIASVTDGEAVTVLGVSRDSDTASWSLVMIKGTLVSLPDGQRAVYDGQGGAYPTSEGILDVVRGTDAGAEFLGHYERLIAPLPTLAPLTADDILDLPRPEDVNKEGPEPIAMVLFGTRPMPGEPAWGSLFFVVDQEDGILGGYLWVSPRSYWESEHGSTYASDMLQADAIAKVVGFDQNLTLGAVMGVLGQGQGFERLSPTEAYGRLMGRD